MSAPIVLLGPQRFSPTLADAVRAHAPAVFDGGRAVAITAGWEEREDEDRELIEHLGGRVTNLALFQRVEEIFQRDPELLGAMRARYDRVRGLQVLYRVRLAHALQALRELMARRGRADGELLEAEIGEALEAVRVLDGQHLERLRSVHAAFDAELRPLERESLANHRDEVARLVADASAVLIAGGHVAVLLNRLRLFDLGRGLADRPLFAWSAGAMTLGERIVVFHDSPPQGKGDPEVLEPGLGLLQGIVPLPHASRRLKLDDPVRVELFARRFAPGPCVALDPESRVVFADGRRRAGAETRALAADGTLIPLEVPA